MIEVLRKGMTPLRPRHCCVYKIIPKIYLWSFSTQTIFIIYLYLHPLIHLAWAVYLFTQLMLICVPWYIFSCSPLFIYVLYVSLMGIFNIHISNRFYFLYKFKFINLWLKFKLMCVCQFISEVQIYVIRSVNLSRIKQLIFML